jgi:hypothetical protein
VPVLDESDGHGQAPYYSLTHHIMPNNKVFRVLIGEKQAFYVDTEATSPSDAMEIVEARLRNPNDDVTPIEDDSAYEGYLVEDAIEIERKDAELDV